MKKYIVAVVAGMALSVAVSFAVDPCQNEAVPCEGQQTPNGTTCTAGCPPTYPDDGCCLITEYRVDCTTGEDQFFKTKSCLMLHTCSDPIGTRVKKCTVF